jgi:DNA-binding PadR family transcriptional regulator
MTVDELTAVLAALPWGERGVPAPLDALLGPARRGRADGGSARLAYQLLAALALSGWSVRIDLQATLHALRATHPGSGSYIRAWRRLGEAGLYETARARFGARPVVLTRLTPYGRAALEDAGVSQMVLSEWEQIEARHRRAEGGEQFPHTAAICMFLHHARVRGFTTVPCPERPLAGAEPDALIRRDAWDIYVEIQRRGGAVWRRARKWRKQYELQGYVAICAASPGLAQELAREAQVAQAPQGVITDLTTLARGAPQALWTHYWASLHSPLQPLARSGEPAFLAAINGAAYSAASFAAPAEAARG